MTRVAPRVNAFERRPRWNGAGLPLRNAAFGLVLAIAFLVGIFVPADRFLTDLNFSLTSRSAADDLVLVEIDARSLKKLNSWPWSRAYHAALIQRLHEAGAAAIAFDIDFSAQSAPAADAALAQAIGAAQGTVILSGFAQPSVQPGSADAFSSNWPLPAFREHAEVGLVNMVADHDGKPRQYRIIEDRLTGSPVTLAALLAEPKRPTDNAFMIDYSIDPASIPRLSYVDVLTGGFDPAVVAGKKVLIGATALELGDRFAVPNHGILPGVEIQALAYSSIARGRAIRPAGAGWVLAGLAVIVIAGTWFGMRQPRWPHAAALIGGVAVLGLGFFLQDVCAISIATAPWLAAIVGGSLLTLIRSAQRHARAALLHRAAALRQKMLMQGVFNDSSEGILIAGADGRVEVANGAAARLLEATPGELIGRSAESILPGLALRDRLDPAEVALIVPSGRQLGLTVSVTRSRPALPGVDLGGDEPLAVWIVTFRDESAKRAMEAARDATLRELQAATAAKNEFLARISHELRTPLSAIIGFSTIIGDQSMGPVGNPKYIEYARDIHSGGKRLLELVNDIIDIVRIEAEQYEIRPDVLEVQSLLGGCCFTIRESEICGERNLRFEVAPGAEAAHSDRQAVAKVIAKLLSNAIKFTGSKGNILLRAKPGRDRAIIFEVTDDGIGIAPNALKNVVAAFSQVHGGLDRRHEGSGLGLYLANRLMQLLGGTLEIESAPAQGTLVRLTIPGALIETSQAA
jgi:signal transduction histidine kinase/CHASE2 domain-containing sensor protein